MIERGFSPSLFLKQCYCVNALRCDVDLLLETRACRVLSSRFSGMLCMSDVQLVAISMSPMKTVRRPLGKIERLLTLWWQPRTILLTMSESKLEQLFSDVVLSLSTPENAFKLPSELPGPTTWLEELFSTTDRKLAYFDEILSAFLVMRVKFDPPESDGRPPVELVAFLTFLQVSFDASYISPEQAPPVPSYTLSNNAGQLLGPPPPGRSGGKPRTGSPLKPRPPPLVPPQTPNPTPRMEDSEKQYAVAEGIQLHSFIWGDAPAKDDRKDDFAILWDVTANEWVIVYRMDVTIGQRISIELKPPP